VSSPLTAPVTAALVCSAVACASAEAPQLTAIEPASGTEKTAHTVAILGAAFYPAVRVDLNQGSTFEGRFYARLGNTDLSAVTYVDRTTLTAVVPPTLPIGRYDLVVRDPEGRTGTLTAAFAVSPATGTIMGGHCDVDDDCAADPCVTAPFCFDGACIYGRDADGDLFIDAACGGADCDDDPAECGADCHPDNTAADLCDGRDTDCDGTVGEDHTLTVTGCGQGACFGNTGQNECQDGAPVDTCDPMAGAAAQDATWDGVDDDCDGATDEDVAAASAHSFVDDFGDGAIGAEWSVSSTTGGCTIHAPPIAHSPQ